ncbi:MAG TPA: hypothetical protein VMP01_08180 [Pirellulaceae bacterium]|nr:hypothetical protein [Pirellulaceae bacterium]
MKARRPDFSAGIHLGHRPSQLYLRDRPDLRRPPELREWQAPLGSHDSQELPSRSCEGCSFP